MPNRDGTGPKERGPKTGRQMGNCKGAEYNEERSRMGQGRGAGRRPRGFGRRQNV